MDRLDRFRGAMVGLALGDAVGDTLRRVGDPLHAPLVLEPPFRWTDDTQVALAAARALVVPQPDKPDAAELGREVSRNLIAWWQDPSREARSPESSTVAAVEQLIRGVDWREAGHPWAEPAVVATRAVPVGLAWAPRAVVPPARVVTAVTHRGAAAFEAAAFMAWMVGCLARGAELQPSLVWMGRERVLSLRRGGGLVHALDAALALAEQAEGRPLQWLPEQAMALASGGDGWRARGAVGLAVLTALRLRDEGPEGFETALELAARIRAGSDHVAALTGALLGARHGLEALPPSLVEGLEDVETVLGLADALYAQAEGVEPPEAQVPHHGAHWEPQHETELDVGDLAWEISELPPPEPPPAPEEPEEFSWVYEGQVDLGARSRTAANWKR